jgi:hypothetical protein
MWSERGIAEHMRQRACEMWSEHGNAEYMKQRGAKCGVSVEMLSI